MYTDQDNGFTIIPPQGWITDKNKKFGLVIFKDSRWRLNSSINVESESTDLKLDEYVVYELDKEQKIPGLSVINKTKIVSNGIDCYLIRMEVKMPYGILHQLQLITVTNAKRSFLVTGMSKDKVWATNEKLINDSLMTFSVLH